MSEQIIDNDDTLYRLNQTVAIIKGLYRGYYGKFKRQERVKGELMYIIEITISEKTQLIRCKIEDTRKIKSVFDVFKKS